MFPTKLTSVEININVKNIDKKLFTLATHILHTANKNLWQKSLLIIFSVLGLHEYLHVRLFPLVNMVIGRRKNKRIHLWLPIYINDKENSGPNGLMRAIEFDIRTY